MKKNVLVFGSVLGILMCISLLYTTNLLYNNPDFKGNDVIGYASMVAIFSLTFFGMLNYRNKQLGGVISFGRAFKAGALIALLGSTIYLIFWLFYYYLVIPDFLEKYISHVLTTCTKEGGTSAELAAKTKEMDSFRQMYKNPLFVILITYSEVLPVGLLVALISALFLKRKKKKEAIS